jgi:hypothetical protein
VLLVEQELPTLPEHLSSPPVFSGVPVTRSVVLCVKFCRSLFVLLFFSFGYCVVCSSSIYRFWLPPFGIFKLFLQDLNLKVSKLSFFISCTCYHDLFVFTGNQWCQTKFDTVGICTRSRPFPRKWNCKRR